ncbi:hypothetical protein T4D_44 [Trichinella pseudospiralis]|uniref:Uncharacterized protein n=1 Tax=Trichinella pseudospiralis TaxID=6337 RepID=A0A0V1F305_TRIPS|nr:hypothetical protein T4D_44 [Trichinella pseudospiralis]
MHYHPPLLHLELFVCVPLHFTSQKPVSLTKNDYNSDLDLTLEYM